jgi:hypothetical protein
MKIHRTEWKGASGTTLVALEHETLTIAIPVYHVEPCEVSALIDGLTECLGIVAGRTLVAPKPEEAVCS